MLRSEAGWGLPTAVSHLGNLAVPSHSVTQSQSPLHLGGPDKGKHQLFCSCPPGGLLGSRASKCKTRDKAYSCRWDHPGSFRIPFLRLRDLTPSHHHPLVLLWQPLHTFDLCSSSDSSSPSPAGQHLTLWATALTSAERNVPPPWCILLKGKSPPTLEHTRRVMGLEANWTGQRRMQCTRRPSKQCHIYYVSVLPGITVTMTFPTLPGTGLEPCPCLPAEALPCLFPPTCTLQSW